MAVSLSDWLRNLRGRLPDRPDVGSDADLLSRYAQTHDDEAFAGLVARHGSMVFGVCRRVCGPGPDAEDAFQAAFVVLAVKAAVVARFGRVGAWLHGVAFHVARKARDRARKHGLTAPDSPDQLPSRETPADPDADHVRDQIDNVLAGLPERYRSCVVLCDVEGLSRKDAAARLGWTEGTLSGRLARARELLADRLTRRGVTLGGGGVAAVLSALAAPAAVAGDLAASALLGAALVTEGTALPAGLAALTDGMTRPMFPTRLQFAAGLVGAGLLVGLGSVLANTRTPERPSPPLAAERPPIPGPAPGRTATKPDGPVWSEKATYKHPSAITTLAFGPDLVAAADASGGLILWDVQTGKEKERILDPDKVKNKSGITWLGFSPDAQWLNVVMMDGHGVAACRLDPKKRTFGGFGSPNSPIRFFGYSADGQYYFHSDGADGARLAIVPNRLIDNMAGGLVAGDLKQDGPITAAVMSADNKVVVTATNKGVVYGWRFKENDVSQLWGVSSGKAMVTALAISPDGKRVVVCGSDGEVRCLDGTTVKELARLKGHDGPVNAVAFSPDGKLIVTGGEDKSVRVWDVSTGKEVAVLKGHTDAVMAVAFGPDGKLIASGSADKTVKVWQFRP
jgi:RNA polymerase sigma factor (sigma-70 family)